MNEQHTDEEHKQEMDGVSNEERETVTEEPILEADVPEGTEEDARYAGLLKLADENQQRFLRAQADFDNFRRRTMKEKEELAQYASLKLIGQLLPVVDNFGRAIEAAKAGGDVESFSKGVDMIFRQFEGVLEAEGLKPMDAVGQPFNPDFHQAIMTVESDEHEEGIVVEEIQKGFMLKDKVLRPAMVKVSG
ncbi:nucleotide exchange factor GrpE [Paenibacillus glycinis]|uniref:Protein GrpE n=1 Tax=Paenibacillus glycinis TaxID=2697035 RepID=A0ABW9XJU1_9BACL|nr:nucleotide exchange factor GrpE [Paenibacillus glycinis]NBD22882.1 nucleotide exchange factor GrpE [Paenibacillus glycinis]